MGLQPTATCSKPSSVICSGVARSDADDRVPGYRKQGRRASALGSADHPRVGKRSKRTTLVLWPTRAIHRGLAGLAEVFGPTHRSRAPAEVSERGLFGRPTSWSSDLCQYLRQGPL